MVKVEDLIIFKGKEQIWDNAKYSVGELDKRKLHRLARAHDAVKSLLVMTRDKEVDPDYGVFMQIPGDFNSRYVIAGPVFAAMLLKEYDLAKELLEVEKPLHQKGFVAREECRSDLEWTEWVWLSQVMVADADIPGDLLLKLHKSIKSNGGYGAGDITVNNGLREILDYVRKGYIDAVSPEEMSWPEKKGVELLENKCPEAFADILEDMKDSIGVEQYVRGADAKSAAAVARFIYEKSSDDPWVVMKFFELETRNVSAEAAWGFSLTEFPKYYFEDVKNVMKLVKYDGVALKHFVKILLLVGTHFSQEPCLKLASGILKKKKNWVIEDIIYGYNEDLESNIVHKMGKTDPFITLDTEDMAKMGYIEYLIQVLSLVKKTMDRQIFLNDVSFIFNGYMNCAITWARYNSVNPMDPFENNSAYKEIVRKINGFLKEFLLIVDTFAVNTPNAEYESMIIQIADEELMQIHFDKKIIHRERAKDILQKAVEQNRVAIIPCIMGNAL